MNEFLPTILTSFATTMAIKGAEAPADTFNETWKYVFGPIDSFFMRKNAKRRIDNEKYIESITQKVEHIPNESLQEPKISILGPALEASKFYIEEDDIREMFASLLASSFDSSKNSILHHAFVEIIKQLTPLDAKNLKLIAPTQDFQIAQYTKVREDGGMNILKSLIFLPDLTSIKNSINEISLEIDRNASSLTNLERLGLIKINFTQWIADDNLYEALENNPIANDYKTLIEENSNTDKFTVKKGIAEITPLGRDFYKICLSE